MVGHSSHMKKFHMSIKYETSHLNDLCTPPTCNRSNVFRFSREKNVNPIVGEITLLFSACVYSLMK